MTLFFTVRAATQHEAALIARQRKLMFAEDKHFSEADLGQMESLYEPWVAAKLAVGDYQGWFAETASGEVIGGVGLWLREWPPILNNYTGKQGFIEERVYAACVSAAGCGAAVDGGAAGVGAHVKRLL